MMHEADGGEGRDAANRSGQRDEPQVMLPDKAQIYSQHQLPPGSTLFRS
jgi:hypothetical protein